VTASPRASTPRTISLPTRPVAPITAVVTVSPSGKARSAPPPTAPAPGGPAQPRSARTIGIARDPGITPPGGRDQAGNLHAEDGTFVAPGRSVSSLAAGLSTLEFRFAAHEIFGAGKAGPFNLRLLSIWGTSTDGAPVSLRASGVVAVTQPYQLVDFAPSPEFTVGGTVTGLLPGEGLLELELAAEGPPGTPTTTTHRAGNGPFTFTFPTLVSGNTYEVRVKTQPTNPAQVCTITNASGTIEDANVTGVEVQCT